MGDEIQKFVDVPGGFLYYPGLGFRDGICSYSTRRLRIFGCGIPMFRGCPDPAGDQPAKTAEPSLHRNQWAAPTRPYRSPYDHRPTILVIEPRRFG